jgi:hypothetical protein
MTETDGALLSTIDPEIIAALDVRASEIAHGASASSKLVAMLALGSVPIALGALANDVYGQAPADVLDVLQFALLLEHLESDFYSNGLNATGLIPPTDRAVFSTISVHELTHVNALRALIQGKGGAPQAQPTFDYTAKGNLPGFAFLATQYATFTMLAQAFEDLGVLAYKGQIGRLVNDKAVLTEVLTIHSVEARHACEVRRLRGKKGWITGESRDDLPAFTQAIYDGESNITQSGVRVASPATDFGGADNASEAFDEPLTMAQVNAILTPFLP